MAERIQLTVEGPGLLTCLCLLTPFIECCDSSLLLWGDFCSLTDIKMLHLFRETVLFRYHFLGALESNNLIFKGFKSFLKIYLKYRYSLRSFIHCSRFFFFETT